MKQMFKFFNLLLIIFAISVTFTSCSNDEEGPMTDPAKAISGTYVGTGKLGLASVSGVTGETYPGMKIIVTKSSNEYVVVTPYLADETPFFKNSTGDVYQITQSANGDFKLSNSNAPRAQLFISKNGHMEYDYPYVTVGGESGYSLQFTGDRQ